MEVQSKSQCQLNSDRTKATGNAHCSAAEVEMFIRRQRTFGVYIIFMCLFIYNYIIF